MKNRKFALLMVGVYALSLIASAITVQPVQAAVAAGYSEYFIPGSTDQLFRIIKDNDNDPDLGNQYQPVSACKTGTTECNEMHNVISVTVATDNLKLYYDHWENGYGTGSAGDEVFTANSGDVLVFESGDILVPRAAANTCTSTNPSGASTRCYDGRDRIYVAGGAVSVAQAFWPEAQNLDTVYSNAWEVYPVKPYQSSYTMPVGIDLVNRGYLDFTNAYLIVQATQDGTTVVIDDPQTTGEETPRTLNRGDVTDDFDFHVGTTITANAPVQVQFIIGQPWSSTASDTRSYTAVPNGLWSSSYFSPVSGYTGGTDVDLYIYNPTAAPLLINYQDTTGSGSFSIPARQTRSYQEMTTRFVPTTGGVYLAAADGVTKFWAIGSYDTESANFNYGFTLIPPEQLTQEYFISWAPGTNTLAANGSPVFVTPVNNDTTVFVDFSPTDGVIDASYTLDRVQSVKIRDLIDNNNTGMHIWATGPIAVVWGEDDQYADVSNPYIDAGYTILPLKQEWLESVLTMDKSANPAAVSSEVGSISEFTLLIQGYAYGLDGVWVFDDLPSGWSYVPGSTTITLPGGSTITGAAAEPAVSGQELTWTKFPSTPLDMGPGDVLKIVYQARVNAAPTDGYVINESTVTGTVGGDTFTASDATTVYMVDMNAAKTSSAGGVVNPGDTITYTVKVNNTGGSTLNDIVITDPLPAGTSYVPQSTKVSLTTAPLVRTYRDDFNAVSYNNSNGTANWSAYDWIETGSDSSGFANAGTTFITGGFLRFNGSTLPSYLTRSAPMAGAISATLSFDYSRFGTTYGTGDSLGVEVKNGATTTRLDTYNGNLPASGTYSRDITAYANAGTQINLAVTGFQDGGSGNLERLDIDSLQIQYSLPGTTTNKDNITGGAVADLVSGVPPTMVGAGDNIDMPAGSSLTLTYQVRVDNPAAAGITNIVNTAEVRSAEMPDPLQATASDRLRGVHLVALKTAAPNTVPETGGNVTFTYKVTNDGVDPVTINTLVDDRFGPLPGDADCKVGTVLAGGASCSFDAVFAIPAGNAGGTHVNNFLVTGSDGFGNTGSTSEGENVTYTNLLPDISVLKTASAPTVAETGGSVTFTYTVTNNSAEAATITSLADDRFGALSGDADCQVGTVLPGNSTCSFSAAFNIPAGNAGGTHTNTFTATVRDNEGSTDTAGESETVTYTNVAPDVSVTKTASPLTILETGGSVTYTFTVTNNSAEAATISSLTDDTFGILAGDADCQVKTVLAGGASCSFDATFVLDAANAGNTHTNVFTAAVIDEEGSTDTASDDATVTYTDALPSISVTKDVDPATLPEEGGPATFTYIVTNDSGEPVVITSLVDGVFGVLDGDTDCQVGTMLDPGESCSFESTFPIPAGDPGDTHISDFTAGAEDNEGNPATDTDDAVVTYTDTLPAITVTKDVDPTELPEEGGSATFTYTVTNDSSEPVEITSLVDGVFGALDGDADCQVGTMLDPGESCDFEATFPVPAGEAGDTHVSDFTAQAEDNEGNPAAGTDDAVVTYTDTPPAISVSKDVDPATLPEEGGPATYTYTVTNDSGEPVQITALVDGVFGVLDGNADCRVGTMLDPGESCSFEATFPIPAGEAGDTHISDFTAGAEDNEGNPATDMDDAVVTYTDTLPAITVTKSADQNELPETGGIVTFTFVVENTGQVEATLDSLTDDVFGDLNGQGTCIVPQTIAVGDSYTCEYTTDLSSDTLTDHVNTVTAVASDTDENSTTVTGTETVTFIDELPEILVSKTAQTTEVPETGGPVTFTFTVVNNSAETVTIDSLLDDQFGTLLGDLSCMVGTQLPAGTSCSFDASFNIPAGGPGGQHVNIFTATASDNDGNTESDSDPETVTYTEVLPEITLTKTADQTNLPESGDSVTFTFVVENVGLEDVTLTSLVDDVFGDLDNQGTCSVPQTIAVGNSYTCQFTTTITGDSLVDHVNTVTATAEDNDGSKDSAVDSETITFNDEPPSYTVAKTASPASLPETGGNVTFTFVVENTGNEALTLSDLTDSVYGNLHGQGDCSVPQTIAAGGSYTCSITEFLSSDTLVSHTNTVSATVGDNDGNTTTGTDGETVTFTDALPEISVTKDVDPATLPEEGGPATFTYSVTNDSSEPVEITSLVDGVFGTLDGNTDCQVGTMLDPGESCSFEATFPIPAGDAGDTHVSDFTADAEDNEGNPATDTDDAVVTYTDTLPAISVVKVADQTELPETGGNVIFTFEVQNTGLEAVTLNSLVDDVLGDLNGKGTCAVPQDIAVGGSYTCQFTTNITGDSLADHVNTVTAEAEDNDSSTATDSDSETITFTDLQPAVAITKTANPTSVPETGGVVTFTFLVKNTGQEAVSLTSLVDDVFGNLNGQGTCAVPQTIAVGGSYTCAITQTISGDTTANHSNTVTASFGDNDGNSSTTTDGAVVSFTNVAPEITALKTAGVSDVPETGGSVTYTYTVTNTGLEPVTIDSLLDDPFGVLPGDVDCQVGTVLAGGESCEFDATFTLPASDRGETHTNTFTAVASDNEGGSDTATDDETVTYTDVEPQISVLKTASVSEVAETGGEVTFTYTVTNLSAEPAMITFLYDDPFGELEGDADCNYTTTLVGGASCSFEATFTLPAGEPGDSHVDIFTAQVSDDEENFAEASENETVTYTNVLPDVSVIKTATAAEVVETGADVTFTFTVTNNSLEDAEITALSDDQFGPLAGDADCQVGTVLAGGASCSFDAVLAIPAGAVGSTHVNTFTATVEDNDGTTDSASESETITYTAAPAPAIAVLKEVFADGSWWDANTAPGPEIRYTQDVSFRFTIRNVGNVTLTGITLADSDYSTTACILPASLSPNDGVDGSGTDEISCIIIAPWVLGQHTNTATASANYGATPVSANDDANYVGVNNAVDLAVTKTDGVATYTPGRALTYTIVVTNNGPDPVVGATFTDLIPAQIANWTWTCVTSGGASGCAGVTNSTANFTNTIDLPVGGVVTYTVTATTRASATTTLTNTAVVNTPAGADDTKPGNNSASDVDTAAPRVNLSMNKAVDGQFRAGQNLSYTLTVTNNGPSDAANVVLSDVLPDEVTYVSANPAIASGPNPVTWNLGTLASGATRTIRLVVRVKDWVNQPFTNTASVTSTTPESSVTDNSDAAVADPQEPTPVTLLYFRAAPSGGLNVLVEWKAETEVDHFAYKLYRSTTPNFEDAVELTVVGSNDEKTYSYTDTVPSAGNYYYWLVDISTEEVVEVHDPVLVIFNAMRFYLPVVGR